MMKKKKLRKKERKTGKKRKERKDAGDRKKPQNKQTNKWQKLTKAQKMTVLIMAVKRPPALVQDSLYCTLWRHYKPVCLPSVQMTVTDWNLWGQKTCGVGFYTFTSPSCPTQRLSWLGNRTRGVHLKVKWVANNNYSLLAVFPGDHPFFCCTFKKTFFSI